MRRTPALPAAAVVALAALVTLPFLGARDLWQPDEPRYAQVAQEMLLDGRWWQPHVNARVYPDKPHLYFWLAAASGLPFGRVTEAAARFPSALAHLLLVALTYRIGRRLFGSEAGLVAAAALATTWLQAWMARRACLDVLLALCAAAAIDAMLRAGDAARAGRRGRSVAWAAAVGVACGLGIMTKGPVVLLAVGAAALALLVHPALRSDRPRGTASLGTAAAVGALAIVLAAWLLPAHALGGYDPLAITKEQVLERAAEGRHHEQPFWYFLVSVPLDFLPWSLLAAPALLAAWRRRSEWPHALLLAWALLPLVVHSVIVEKRNIYVLPVLPAWTLLVGAWAASGAAGAGARRAAWAACGLLALVAAGTLAAAGGAGGSDVAEAIALPGVRAALLAAGGVTLAATVLLVRALRRAPSVPAACGAIAAAYGATLAALFLVLPLTDELKSGRTLGAELRRVADGRPAGMFPRTWDAYVYYSGRPLKDLEDAEAVRRWLGEVGRPAFVLAYEKDLPQLPGDAGTPPVSIFSDDVGHPRVHILCYGLPRGD